MPDLPELYRLGKNRKERDFATEVTQDYGVKGLSPQLFTPGQSHVSLQVFLPWQTVKNPVVETSYRATAPADASKVLTIETSYRASTPADASKVLTIESIYEATVE